MQSHQVRKGKIVNNKFVIDVKFSHPILDLNLVSYTIHILIFVQFVLLMDYKAVHKIEMINSIQNLRKEKDVLIISGIQ